GVKAGMGRDKWGLFAKARPGFIRYSRVGDLGPLTSTSPQTYLLLDLGACLELYPASHTIIRFELGNEVINFPLRSLTIANGNTFSTFSGLRSTASVGVG